MTESTLWQLLNNIGHDETLSISHDGQRLLVRRTLMKDGKKIDSEKCVTVEEANLSRADMVAQILWETAVAVRGAA